MLINKFLTEIVISGSRLMTSFDQIFYHVVFVLCFVLWFCFKIILS